MLHANARHRVHGLLAKPGQPMMYIGTEKGLYGLRSQTRPCAPPTSDTECRISPDHHCHHATLPLYCVGISCCCFTSNSSRPTMSPSCFH
ncbi:hypothetical protein CGRA01v4_13075 [Colletotrichum graminicola]|nr:hypothetical protein CGRA01v4_13075 [Colletotrichum graminicola]